MPLKLSPLLWEDIDAFGVLDEAAMEDWTFARLMDTSGRPRREFAAEWTRKGWNKDDKSHWLKVTDTVTDELMAVALWRLPLQNEAADKDKADVDTAKDTTPPQEELTDKEAVTRRFWAEAEKTKNDFAEHFIGTRVYAYLQLLVAHPSHRRRGAGSMLVKWGCDQADELGIVCALMASTAGEAVYKKHGFVVKQVTEMDLSPFGVDQVELRRGMIREPRD